MNNANPQEHFPEAECNNRVIKEFMHASYHQLLYEHLRWLMFKILVTESAKKLIFFPPAKNRIFPYYSPRMILWSYINKKLGLCSTLPIWIWHWCPSTWRICDFEKVHHAAQILLIFDTMTMWKEVVSYYSSQRICWSLDVELLPYHLLRES